MFLYIHYMKHLTTYQNYKKKNIEDILESYFNGDFDNIEEQLDSLISINENIFTWIKDTWNKAKSKTEEFILDICIKAYVKIMPIITGVKKLLNKVVKVLFWILQKLANFQKKHPILFKIILSSTLIILLILLSSSSAMAKGEKINVQEYYGLTEDQLNYILGYTKEYGTTKETAMIVDLKDGVVDGPWSLHDITKVLSDECHNLDKYNTKMRELISRPGNEPVYPFTKDSYMAYDRQTFIDAGKKLVNFTLQIIKGENFSQEKIALYSSK